MMVRGISVGKENALFTHTETHIRTPPPAVAAFFVVFASRSEGHFLKAYQMYAASLAAEHEPAAALRRVISCV